MSGLDDVIKGGAGGQGGGLGDILGGLAGGGVSGGGGLGGILGGLVGIGGTTGAQAGGMGSLLGRLLPMLGGMLAGGGLQKVLSGFEANGLSAQVDSWVGDGENEPLSGAEVRKVVGEDELAKIATKLGVSEDDAAAAIAQVLPEVVNKVSPDGHLGSTSDLDSAFGALEELGGGNPPAPLE
jgi:uncharacterized protein YidB (DUF937 family)